MSRKQATIVVERFFLSLVGAKEHWGSVVWRKDPASEMRVRNEQRFIPARWLGVGKSYGVTLAGGTPQ